MIDVSNATNYNYTDNEIEEFIIFWILAAGKNGRLAALNLDKMLTFLRSEYGNLSPFSLLLKVDDLPSLMKTYGIGCHNKKSKTIIDLINSNLDLRSCSHYDLEKIKGIGRKTSRAFIVHSRKDANFAVVDRHLLQYLNDMGHKVPLVVPTEKDYDAIGKIFLSLVPPYFTVAEFDLLIWRIYSGN